MERERPRLRDRAKDRLKRLVSGNHGSAGHPDQIAQVSSTSLETSHCQERHEPNTHRKGHDKQQRDDEKRNDDSKDLWKIAFDKLEKPDQQILGGGADANVLELIKGVVQTTEKQYQEYKTSGLTLPRGTGKDDVNIRDAAFKIINTTLSFDNTVKALTAFDPTGYASKAWGFVSQLLTLAQNHHDIKLALFESSAFLADTLSYCAFVEKTCRQTGIWQDVEDDVIRVYTDILQYTAQVQKMQQSNAADKVLWFQSSVEDHELAQIKATIEKDQEKLFQRVAQNQHLQHQKTAEDILRQVDKTFEMMKESFRNSVFRDIANAEGAVFDASENEHDDLCFPETRTELLERINHWGSSPQGPCMFWLSGSAGTGKSTISRTVAKSFQESGMLGASFFFKRGGGDRANASKFFPTITKQLVTKIPQLADYVTQSIGSNFDITGASKRRQFEVLLLEPLRRLDESKAVNIVIVIDALDECDDNRDRELLLELLPRLGTLKNIHIRIFLTSRDDWDIKDAFEDKALSGNHQVSMNDIDEATTERDISRFLRGRLKDINKRRHRNHSTNWPEESDIQSLIKMSVPLFIFADTVCRVLEDRGSNPREKLTEILRFKNERATLYPVYWPILTGLLPTNPPPSEKEEEDTIKGFHEVVGTIILLQTPLSIESLGKLIEVPIDTIIARLNGLHAVLKIDPDNPTAPVQLYHASFREFLLSSAYREVQRWRMNERRVHQTHMTLALQCLRVMDGGLKKKDLCNVKDDGVQRTEIPEDTINDVLHPELQYACRYWIHHLEQCQGAEDLMQEAASFLQKKFLFWMEAMSLLGHVFEIAEGIEKLRKLQSLRNDDVDAELSSLLRDAARFVKKFRHVADIAPLQIYCSGLIFAPTKSVIRTSFGHLIPKWIHTPPQVEEQWNAELETFEDHSDWVQSVVFSPDSRWLASGSDDSTARIWNMATGALEHTLEHDNSYVYSLAFSENTRLLASGSRDGIIKLWDPATGALQDTINGHDGPVYSIAFSATGEFLASGSEDKTIKLWDSENRLVHTFNGHDRDVYSVALSRNGQWLASGSGDGTIKLWNLSTMELEWTSECQHRNIMSVAFSKDGQWIASGSYDKTVEFWDRSSGTPSYTFNDHHYPVYCVAFSRDGRWLVSGDSDGTMKVWNLTEKKLQSSFKGHSSTVMSVAFSPNGQWLASGSWDRTIKIWDLDFSALQSSPEEPQNTLMGHDGPVANVTVSQDGRLLISGSRAGLKLWDLENKSLKRDFKRRWFEHLTVILSSDGRWLAANDSKQGSINLWDIHTGMLMHVLLVGHESPSEMKFSHDGETLAAAFFHDSLQLWSVATGTLKWDYTVRHIYSMAFSQDGRWLVLWASRGHIDLLDLTTGLLQWRLEGGALQCNLVVFSQDGQWLGSGIDENTIMLRNTTANSVPDKGYSGLVNLVVLSENGRWLRCVNPDNVTFKVRDPATGNLQRESHEDSTYRVTLPLKERWLSSFRRSSQRLVPSHVCHDIEVDAYATEVATAEIKIPANDIFGTIHLQSMYGQDCSDISQPKTVVDIQEKQWVMLQGRRALWLPAAYRPEAFEVRGDQLSIGHDNGRVSYMRFCQEGLFD